MPVYEFRCKSCDKQFSLTLSVREYEGKDHSCPGCKGKDLERVYSTLQVITSRKS